MGNFSVVLGCLCIMIACVISALIRFPSHEIKVFMIKHCHYDPQQLVLLENIYCSLCSCLGCRSRACLISAAVAMGIDGATRSPPFPAIGRIKYFQYLIHLSPHSTNSDDPPHFLMHYYRTSVFHIKIELLHNKAIALYPTILP